MGGIETDYNPPAYFVLVLITRGIFDDLKETVQVLEIKFGFSNQF